MSKRKANEEAEPRMDRLVKRRIEKLEKKLAKSEQDKAVLVATTQTQENMLHRFFLHVGGLRAPATPKQLTSPDTMSDDDAERKEPMSPLLLPPAALSIKHEDGLPPLEHADGDWYNDELDEKHDQKPSSPTLANVESSSAPQKEAKRAVAQGSAPLEQGPAQPAKGPAPSELEPTSIQLNVQPTVRAIFPIPVRYQVTDKRFFSKKVLDQTGEFPVPVWNDTETKEHCWLHVKDVFTVCNRVRPCAPLQCLILFIVS